MTTYTTNELATRVLKDLGLVASEETPYDADLQWAVETVESEIMMLNAKDIPIWNGSEVEIPQEYLTLLSRRIGLAVAPSFGLMSHSDAQQAMPLVDADLRILGMTPGNMPDCSIPYHYPKPVKGHPTSLCVVIARGGIRRAG